MKISEIKNLKPETPIPVFEGTVKAVFPVKETGGQWAKKLQNCIVFDETGEHYLTFAGKSNQHDENEIKGKKIKVACSKSRDGAPQGVKLKVEESKGKSYPKIWVTDSAVFTITGDGGSPPAGGSSSQSAPSGRSYPDQQRKHIIKEGDVKSFAKAWLHTYELMKPQFEEASLLELLPERVTACLMSILKNDHFMIEGDVPKEDDWKDVEFSSGKKLGDLKAAQLLKICSKIFRSEAHKPKWEACRAGIKSLITGGTVEDVLALAINSLHPGKLKSLGDLRVFIEKESIQDEDGIISCLTDDDIIDKITPPGDDATDLDFDDTLDIG